MSCSSPFALAANTSSEYVTTTTSMNLQGCYNLPGYTSPSWNACVPYWVPGYPCCWYCCGNCWGGCCCTAPGWSNGYTAWYCYTVPGVELWPALQFCGGVNLPLTASASVGLDFSVDAPAEPYQCMSVTLGACEIDASVNGSGFKINILPDPLQLTEKNGDFSSTMDLGGFSSDYNYGGVDYSLSISASLLLCLTPEPPMGWVNIDLDCSFAATVAYVATETVSFDLSLIHI